MLKNKDLNFKALIQKTKTQSKSLSPHSTMSHALTHTHLYANQNQHHYCSALIVLYKSKHNPISAKEKKNTKHCLFSPNSKEDPNHAKLKKSNLNPKWLEWRNGDWKIFCHKLKADLNMEIYRAYKDKAYIHKRKNIQSMYPQIFFSTQKRTNKACTDLKIF